MSMQMDQLFHCEPGEGAQTLHDLSSAAAGGHGYIMQKPGPPMLSSRHAEWYAASHHQREKVRGSNRLAYSTVPQSELSLERGRKRERARERERELKAKEIKKQKKQRERESWEENKRGRRKGREQ